MKFLNLGYSFTQTDIDAILLALPLVISYGADTAEQQELNAQLCMSAGSKLALYSRNLTMEEFRVIYAAVEVAVIFLSGECPERFEDVDDEERAALAPHFFTFNKLRSYFNQFADEQGL